MNTRFVDYRGTPILYIDLANVKTEQDAFERISESKQIIASQPTGSLLTLTDSRDSLFSRDVIDALRQYTDHNKPFVKAAALVGVSGLQKLVLSAVAKFSGRTFKIFTNPDDAMAWLARQ